MGGYYPPQIFEWGDGNTKYPPQILGSLRYVLYIPSPKYFELKLQNCSRCTPFYVHRRLQNQKILAARYRSPQLLQQNRHFAEEQARCISYLPIVWSGGVTRCLVGFGIKLFRNLKQTPFFFVWSGPKDQAVSSPKVPWFFIFNLFFDTIYKKHR